MSNDKKNYLLEKKADIEAELDAFDELLDITDEPDTPKPMSSAAFGNKLMAFKDRLQREEEMRARKKLRM